MTLDEFFSGREDSRRIFDTLRAAIDALGLAEMRVTKSQVAFRRGKAFAWAWVPGRYLRGRHAPLVLTLSFAQRDDSVRWKQIVEPAPGRFTHHLELHTASEIDDEVRCWLQEAWEAAAQNRHTSDGRVGPSETSKSKSAPQQSNRSGERAGQSPRAAQSKPLSFEPKKTGFTTKIMDVNKEGQMTTTFPVIASTLSPQALASDILPGFGVGAVAECKYYSGGFNDTFRVKTVDGSTYYLRAYRIQWRTLADIQYELDVLNHLKRKGFPAAKPVPYKDGQPFCAVPAPEGRRYLALFTEAPGPEISYDHEPGKVAQRYGHAVAQMHNALDDFSSPHPRFHKDIEHFIDRPLRHIEPFLSYRPDDWSYVQRFAETLRQRILSVPADELEQDVCHGDLQGYHANVAPDGTLTFFDFDCGGYGYRAYDLAVFLWCCRLEDAVDVRWEPFLNSYRQVRRINELDVQAIPLFVCARYLWHMGVHTQNSPDWGIGFLNDKYFDSHLKRLREAEQDYLMDGPKCP